MRRKLTCPLSCSCSCFRCWILGWVDGSYSSAVPQPFLSPDCAGLSLDCPSTSYWMPLKMDRFHKQSENALLKLLREVCIIHLEKKISISPTCLSVIKF